MTPTQLATLERIARAATQQSWKWQEFTAEVTPARVLEMVAELRALREANQWIPCSERMPADESLVLCLHQHASWPGCNYSFGSWCFVGEIEEGGGTHIWYDENDDMADWEMVTHWRPLPPAPVKQGETTP
jgi:hypothetical protein